MSIKVEYIVGCRSSLDYEVASVFWVFARMWLTLCVGSIYSRFRLEEICVHSSCLRPHDIGQASRSGGLWGPREIIEDGVDGLMASYGNPQALAETERHLGRSEVG